MPAAARQSERRPSAPISKPRARRVAPPLSATVTVASSVSIARASSSIRRSDGQRARARFERREQMPVLDIVAERVEADLGCGETHLRRADQPRRSSSTIRMTRSGAACRGAAGPDAERVERGHRAGQQGGGAVVGGRRAGDQRGFDAGLGERDARR